MRRRTWGLLCLGGALLGLMLSLDAGAQAPMAPPRKAPAFQAGLAAASNVKEATVEKVLKGMGKAVTEQLKAGREVEIKGVGILRVVQTAPTRDLVNGIVTEIPARNYVEFVPAEEMNAAAKSPGAVPARIVPAYEFRVNPNSNQGLKADTLKTNRSRAGRGSGGY